MDATQPASRQLFFISLVLLNQGPEALTDFERAACERCVLAYRQGNQTISAWDAETVIAAVAAIYL